MVVIWQHVYFRASQLQRQFAFRNLLLGIRIIQLFQLRLSFQKAKAVSYEHVGDDGLFI